MMWHKMSKTLSPIRKRMLVRLRVRALRRRVWFKVLDRLERAGVELTIKVVDAVRSPVLARMLLSVVAKLMDAMESPVARMMREVGSDLVRRASRIAQQWGHRSAHRWKADLRFIRFLAVMQMCTSPMFST